jgi:hypothetical protein
MKVIIILKRSTLVNGAISVSCRFRKQRPEVTVILFQNNFRQLIVARPARFP